MRALLLPSKLKMAETLYSLPSERQVVWLVTYNCSGSLVSPTVRAQSKEAVCNVRESIESFRLQLTGESLDVCRARGASLPEDKGIRTVFSMCNPRMVLTIGEKRRKHEKHRQSHQRMVDLAMLQ